MRRALSFYHGKLAVELLLVIALVGVSLYSLINLSRYGQFFGKAEYKKIDLIELLSYGNVRNEKNVCTEGYFVKTDKLSILKVSLSDDQFTRSAWIRTEGEIINQYPGSDNRYVRAVICGFFESKRAGEFGDPPVWNHQITVSSYETLGDTQRLEKSF